MKQRFRKNVVKLSKELERLYESDVEKKKDLNRKTAEKAISTLMYSYRQTTQKKAPLAVHMHSTSWKRKYVPIEKHTWTV